MTSVGGFLSQDGKFKVNSCLLRGNKMDFDVDAISAKLIAVPDPKPVKAHFNFTLQQSIVKKLDLLQENLAKAGMPLSRAKIVERIIALAIGNRDLRDVSSYLMRRGYEREGKCIPVGLRFLPETIRPLNQLAQMCGLTRSELLEVLIRDVISSGK